MSTAEEKATFRHSKFTTGCFLKPKPKCPYLFGFLLHNIGFAWEDDHGMFFLEDGSFMTFNLKIVDDAHQRATKGDKAFSEYLREAPEHKTNLGHVDRVFRQ